MSLVERPLPLRELNEKLEQVQARADKYPEEARFEPEMFDDLYDDMDDSIMIEEAAMVNTKESKKAESIVEPPALPKRSSLRTSRFLEELKLSSIDDTAQSFSTSHASYMSSEEDASSSADEFSDYAYDSGSEESQKSPVSRKSQEDTARAVSVVFVGKPAIVQVPSHRRSMASSRDSHSRDSSLNSLSSNDSLPQRQDPASVTRPVRQSSLLPSVFTKPRPAFLTTDPYKGSYKYEGHQEEIKDSSIPRTPKTPTAMLRNVSRTISLARKRSKPMLNDVMEATSSRDNLAVSASHSASNVINTTLPVEQSKPVETSPDTPTSVTYNDIVRSAKKNAAVALPETAPSSPISSPDSSKRRILSGLNRRKTFRP